ncbi:unnamed protein product [Fraxinus pennsylvanica]|uniref:non-specific serine/threonine protein kinase n=1 Tax=Fraxinus pennsylvanica TaxID=56036 RepID=A0AAD1Z130_9LAMI|nr:unnamed protein product [Fraxinus pennsylvanica]
MYTNFLHIFSLFIITTLVLLYFPGSFCQNGGEYAACGAPFRCAGIQEISYPFWGGNRPDYCGYPGFQLNNCQGDVPILTISSIQYRVLEINSTAHTLKVAREDLWNNTCPRFLYNTTLNRNLFEFSPNDQNVTLHYGCSTSSGQPSPRPPHMFDCTVNGTNSESLFTIGEDSPSIPGTGTDIRCDTNISVPVNETAAGNLAGSTASIVLLQDALASGFSLQWSANNRVCRNCIRSGGLCGTNQDSQALACYCADGTHASICNTTQTRNNTQNGINTQTGNTTQTGNITLTGNNTQTGTRNGLRFGCRIKERKGLDDKWKPYRVLEIDDSTKTVRVAREDLWNTTCPRSFYNTTLEQNIFLLSPNYPNITLYYGCSTFNGQPIPQLPSMFPCVGNDTSSASFFTVGGNFPSIPGFETDIRCETSISVPVNQTAAEFLAGSTASIVLLRDALASGFSLQWSANNNVCENCTRSGGLCGTNRDSQSFACYCVSGTSASTCNSIETENGT